MNSISNSQLGYKGFRQIHLYYKPSELTFSALVRLKINLDYIFDHPSNSLENTLLIKRPREPKNLNPCHHVVGKRLKSQELIRPRLDCKIMYKNYQGAIKDNIVVINFRFKLRNKVIIFYVHKLKSHKRLPQ